MGLEEFDALCNAVLRARIEALRIYAAKLSGRYDETAPRDPLFKVPEGLEKPPIVSPPGPSLTELADRYCEFKSKHEWVAKSAADNRRILGLFIELSGKERPINSLGDEDIRGYRDALMVMPANFTKRKGATREQLLALLKQVPGKSGNIVSKPTAQKYFDKLRAFLKWCADEGYIDKTPGKTVRGFTMTRAEAKDARRPFSVEQLRKLFQSSLYTGCYSDQRRSRTGTRVYRDGKLCFGME